MVLYWFKAKNIYAHALCSLPLTCVLSLSLSSFSLSRSPEEDPAIKQFGEEVANEENLFAELQTASGIDQIITENEKLITEK